MMMASPVKYIFLLGVVILTTCNENQKDTFVKNARFNPETGILLVDYDRSPDTSLQQIILLSGIRQSGYGLLLNIDSAMATGLGTELQYRLKKLDINAVHVFNVSSEKGLSKEAGVAIEGARFNWIFSSTDYIPDQSGLPALDSAIIKSLQTGGILIKQ